MISSAQRKRNKILREYKKSSLINQRLPIIENMIKIIQKDIVYSQVVRAGCHWRENGEISAGYLKRTIATRSSRQNITSLIYRATEEICTSPEGLQNATTAFYSDLYTHANIDNLCVQILCDTISPHHTIPKEDHTILNKPFNLQDLIKEASRSPRHSSPGTDSLPYELLFVLF